MTWPPAATSEDQWRTKTLARTGETVRLRQVILWGGDEWINEAGDVLCGCGQMVPIAVLCTRGNGHINSPVSEAIEKRSPTIAELVAASSAPSSAAVFI